MTFPLIPEVISLGEPSSWMSVPEAAIASLPIRSMIGGDVAAALVVRRELVDGHRHVHGRTIDPVLACDDPERT